MIRQKRKLRWGRKSVFALIAVAVVLFATASMATIIVHTHTQTGHSVQETGLPQTGNWRCKAEAPTDGRQQSMFEVFDALQGYVSAVDGESKCGKPVNLTGPGWTFKTIADITTGTGIGRGWSNEQAEPYCPNENPN